MRFSIIVPVYNTEKYLGECLDSLINQTYRDFEVILIDDGSTDGSPRICDMYAEKYSDTIKVFHKSNGGLISARIAGNKKASGDYILNVDSDDFVSENLLKTLNDKIIEYGYPDMVIYSFVYYHNGRTENRKKTLSNSDSIFEGVKKRKLYEALISGNLITSIWTKATKRDIINSNPTDYSEYYDKNMGEDLLQSLFIVTQSDRILYINDALYYYRYNHNSISRSVSVQMLDKNTMIHIYFEALKFLDIWGLKTKANIMKLNANFLSYAVYTFDRFYLNAKTAKEKRTVLYYDWTKFVSVEMFEGFKDNPYVSSGYKMLWKMISEKKSLRIRIFYMKKKIKKKLKHMRGNLKHMRGKV